MITVVLVLVIWVLSVAGCYLLAERKGLSTSSAIVWGVLFGWFALFIYAISPRQTPEAPTPARPDLATSDRR